MIERYFTIKNFRSVGIHELQHFDLNYLLNNSDSYGGLVTIIGENNSGKSNVLEAIKAFGKKTVSPNDIPLQSLSDETLPEINLFLKDHSSGLNGIVKFKGGEYDVQLLQNNSAYNLSKDKKPLSEEAQLFIDDFLRFYNEDNKDRNRGVQRGRALPIEVVRYLNKLDKEEYITEQEMNQIRSAIQTTTVGRILLEQYKVDIVNSLLENITNSLVSSSASTRDGMINDKVRELFKIKMIPKIIEYKDDSKIKGSDIRSTITNGVIQTPAFFIKLYSLIDGQDFKELQNAYKRFYDSQKLKISILSNYERKINQAISKLADQFNQIYTFNGDKKYDFKLKIETNDIYFMISENSEDIYLDNQSTGFKWFFDFFFNVFADKKIEAGDIIVLDEPATNLHVSGQIELRKQIKDFGTKTGITFVMCTHSPFLIDPDFLDEVRIVSKEGYESKIKNKFTVDDKKEIDVMVPIKAALTVNRHIILNPDDVLIFVEGITDYNYLVMGKKLLKMDNITFMPIQGIKRTNIDKDLLAITKYPILLVDSDKAGENIFEKFKNKSGIEIIRLKDVNEKFREIEDIFNEQELTKWSIKDKDYKVTSALKNALIRGEVKLSATTKENFKLLFERLSN
jgi:AAA15 family ATPase/GTPase